MNNSNIETDNMPDYNDEPVYYCADCLSLRIKNVECIENSEFCDDCGSTNIKEASIEEWNELYKKRYGHTYLEDYGK